MTPEEYIALLFGDKLERQPQSLEVLDAMRSLLKEEREECMELAEGLIAEARFDEIPQAILQRGK